jgi:Protein of unknown function (DUF559)
VKKLWEKRKISPVLLFQRGGPAVDTDFRVLYWRKIPLSFVVSSPFDIRDKYMESVGLKVLRFSDREVFENLAGVLEKIWNGVD